MINGATALSEMVRTATGTDEPGAHRMLPVASELSGLLPGRGLRRGSTVAVAGGRAAPAGGGTSLMLALLAAASRSGSWCAVVGVPTLGALAAAESGIVLERLALVPNPGPEWPTVVAALIDGVDVVVTAVPGPVPASITGRLAARARQRGSVLVPFGDWSGADVTLQVGAGRWEGLGPGRGRLRRREVTVLARGRGAAARPKEMTMWMPGISVLTPAENRGEPARGPVTAPVAPAAPPSPTVKPAAAAAAARIAEPARTSAVAAAARTAEPGAAAAAARIAEPARTSAAADAARTDKPAPHPAEPPRLPARAGHLASVPTGAALTSPGGSAK